MWVVGRFRLYRSWEGSRRRVSGVDDGPKSPPFVGQGGGSRDVGFYPLSLFRVGPRARLRVGRS